MVAVGFNPRCGPAPTRVSKRRSNHAPKRSRLWLAFQRRYATHCGCFPIRGLKPTATFKGRYATVQMLICAQAGCAATHELHSSKFRQLNFNAKEQRRRAAKGTGLMGLTPALTAQVNVVQPGDPT